MGEQPKKSGPVTLSMGEQSRPSGGPPVMNMGGPPTLSMGEGPPVMNMGGPPTLSMGEGPPMLSMGGGGGLYMGEGPEDKIRPPENVNTAPEFVAAKEAQYAACLKMINESIGDNFSERAFGCIIGAFLGDACGAYIEFDERMASPQKVEDAMKMPGGGYFGCIGGQVTDDSEMMMSLMIGYIKSNEGIAADQDKVVDFNVIASQYSDWYTSDPFDIG